MKTLTKNSPEFLTFCIAYGYFPTATGKVIGKNKTAWQLFLAHQKISKGQHGQMKTPTFAWLPYDQSSPHLPLGTVFAGGVVVASKPGFLLIAASVAHTSIVKVECEDVKASLAQYSLALTSPKIMKKQPHKFKAVSFAYPTSPFAVQHGFGKIGCWHVETFTDLGKAKSHRVFVTEDEAYQHAATLPQEYHWSDIREYARLGRLK